VLVFVASVVATSVVQPPAPDSTPAPAVVDDTPPHRLAVDLELGIGFAGTSTLSPGPALTLGIDVGYHIDRDTSLGIHVSEGSFSGTLPGSVAGSSYSYFPVSVDAYAAERFLGICWGGFLLGAHFDRTSGGGMPTQWTGNIELGLALGVDIWRWQDQSLGLFALTESEVSDNGYVGAIVGVAYRR
jgi:hypothetical protein